MGLFRRLFGAKKTGDHQSSPAKEKRRWRFSRSSSNTTPSQFNNKRVDESLTSLFDGNNNLDANKHAIAVAAATAAVAEAALAAAHAAAEVVRLTNAGSRGGGATTSRHVRSTVELAAVKIQSAFRGYLARRALKALKALVKLQALVRGYIVRKQTADMLKRMQTLVKVQARARSSRSHMSNNFHSSSKSSLSRQSVPAEHQLRAHTTKFDGPSILKRCGSNSNFRDMTDLDKARIGSNWLDRWMEESLRNNHRSDPPKNGHMDDEKSDKILEVDTWKPHLNSQQYNRTYRTSQHSPSSDYNNRGYMTVDSPSKLSSRTMNNPIPSVSSGEVLSLSSLKLQVAKAEAALRTAESSPQGFSASYRPGSSSSARRGGPFTPTKSECSWGFFGGYSGYPNYMAYTESSRAKVRSQSAPRQRLEFERYGSSKRSSSPGLWDARSNSERDFAQDTDFRNKAYPTYDSLNRVGSSNLR